MSNIVAIGGPNNLSWHRRVIEARTHIRACLLLMADGFGPGRIATNEELEMVEAMISAAKKVDQVATWLDDLSAMPAPASNEETPQPAA